MFADAVDKAREFTRPVVISRLLRDGNIQCSVGTFVVLNPEGWILSAWHIVQGIQDSDKQADDWRTYDDEVERIKADSSLGDQEKADRIARITTPDQQVQLTNPEARACVLYSPWWSWDGVSLSGVTGIALPMADVVVGRLEPFDPAWVKGYPEIKDPTKGLRQGTSLCRVGFPFPTIKATFDQQRRGFVFGKGDMQLPLFPIEGILTRMIEAGRHQRGYRLGFLETSSPGLMGQSGGPIIDVHGGIWSIQSNTRHLSLGFNPEIPGKPGEKEHQFLNVGWGTHPETIKGLLDEVGVAHSLTAY